MMVLKWSCKFIVFFCRFAIDTMQSVCLDEFGGEKAVHPGSQETTIIQHIFGGQLQSQVMHLLVKCFTSCFKSVFSVLVMLSYLQLHVLILVPMVRNLKKTKTSSELSSFLIFEIFLLFEP